MTIPLVLLLVLSHYCLITINDYWCPLYNNTAPCRLVLIRAVGFRLVAGVPARQVLLVRLAVAAASPNTRRTANGERKKPWMKRVENSGEIAQKTAKKLDLWWIYADLCWLMWVFVDDHHAICIICIICHLPYHLYQSSRTKLGHSQNHSQNHSWLVVLAVPIWRKMMEWTLMGLGWHIQFFWNGKSSIQVPVTTNQIGFNTKNGLMTWGWFGGSLHDLGKLHIWRSPIGKKTNTHFFQPVF